MSTPSLDDITNLFDSLFPDEKCPNCGDITPKIEIKCPCKFEFSSCAECLSNNRDTVKDALKDHADRCDNGNSILSALGF